MPIASMGRDVVGDGGRGHDASIQAHLAERVGSQLRLGALAPAVERVLRPPVGALDWVEGLFARGCHSAAMWSATGCCGPNRARNEIDSTCRNLCCAGG